MVDRNGRTLEVGQTVKLYHKTYNEWRRWKITGYSRWNGMFEVVPEESHNGWSNLKTYSLGQESEHIEIINKRSYRPSWW